MTLKSSIAIALIAAISFAAGRAAAQNAVTIPLDDPTPMSLVKTASPAASSSSSFLFGNSALDAFGRPGQASSARYFAQARTLLAEGFAPLTHTLGSAQPRDLRILIKDDAIATPITEKYVETLSHEKSFLMRIYGLSDSDYNRLAAIAFGILGRETKFGQSFKYKVKEANQSAISRFKAMRAELKGLFSGEDVAAAANSRGLTQIKDVPDQIEHFYCANETMLNDPRVTAVATMGFLADSLRILKNRVRNQRLDYITDANLFDYVLYVYFGSMRKLVNPVIDYNTGRLVREPATPALNLYVQTVRRYMKSLAFFEKAGPLALKTDSACRIPGDH